MAQYTYEVEQEKKRKRKIMSFTTKLYLFLFVFFGGLAVLLFARVDSANVPTYPIPGEPIKNGGALGLDSGTTLVAAIIASVLCVFMGIMCFLRFLRSRSVAGGLFFTTAVSTASFLGASRLIGAFMPMQGVVHGVPGVMPANPAFDLTLLFAQLGLFAVWFCILLFTIRAQVSPIKRVDYYLEKIIEDEEIKQRIRIGKSRQYKSIEIKLRTLSNLQKEARAIAKDAMEGKQIDREKGKPKVKMSETGELEITLPPPEKITWKEKIKKRKENLQEHERPPVDDIPFI